ncbi:MAG: hypothetical protein ACLSCR_07200 [Akkermansia sp.]
MIGLAAMLMRRRRG